MAEKKPKKIVFFLVEGESDKLALETSMQALFYYNTGFEAKFLTIEHDEEDEDEGSGDITSARYIGENNEPIYISKRDIEDKIYYYYFLNYNKIKPLLPQDAERIIHIVDLDGAYIPNADVIENPSAARTEYKNDHIEHHNRNSIIKRNKQKSENMDYLSYHDTISLNGVDVPYSIFFFSSNLDHFTENDANLKGKKVKTNKAKIFNRRFIGQLERFVKYFTGDPDSLKNMSYKESWEYVRKGTNSLKRHTNLNILIKELWEKGNKK